MAFGPAREFSPDNRNQLHYFFFRTREKIIIFGKIKFPVFALDIAPVYRKPNETNAEIVHDCIIRFSRIKRELARHNGTKSHSVFRISPLRNSVPRDEKKRERQKREKPDDTDDFPQNAVSHKTSCRINFCDNFFKFRAKKVKRNEDVMAITANSDEPFAAEIWGNEPECYSARGLWVFRVRIYFFDVVVARKRVEKGLKRGRARLGKRDIGLCAVDETRFLCADAGGGKGVLYALGFARKRLDNPLAVDFFVVARARVNYRELNLIIRHVRGLREVNAKKPSLFKIPQNRAGVGKFCVMVIKNLSDFCERSICIVRDPFDENEYSLRTERFVEKFARGASVSGTRRALDRARDILFRQSGRARVENRRAKARICRGVRAPGARRRRY